jgi:hypothetical protein
MVFYKIQKLIDGYRVQVPGGVLVVAVPEQKLGNWDTDVEFNGQHMIIKAGQKPLTTKSFPDKFNREQFYTLCYFEWIPIVDKKKDIQQSLI